MTVFNKASLDSHRIGRTFSGPPLEVVFNTGIITETRFCICEKSTNAGIGWPLPSIGRIPML